jgi:hypothetical protein
VGTAEVVRYRLAKLSMLLAGLAALQRAARCVQRGQFTGLQPTAVVGLTAVTRLDRADLRNFLDEALRAGPRARMSLGETVAVRLLVVATAGVERPHLQRLFDP